MAKAHSRGARTASWCGRIPPIRRCRITTWRWQSLWPPAAPMSSNSIISASLQRFEKITKDSGVVVRPWLQAFAWRTKTYSPQYIETQVRVARENGGIGFLFWNARNDYGRPFAAMPQMRADAAHYFQAQSGGKTAQAAASSGPGR